VREGALRPLTLRVHSAAFLPHENRRAAAAYIVLFRRALPAAVRELVAAADDFVAPSAVRAVLHRHGVNLRYMNAARRLCLQWGGASAGRVAQTLFEEMCVRAMKHLAVWLGPLALERGSLATDSASAAVVWALHGLFGKDTLEIGALLAARRRGAAAAARA
jgi:hypothetical protein